MVRPIKYTWTPEAKKRAVELWNQKRSAKQIAQTITSEFNLPHTHHTVQSLYRKEGAALGMINGVDKIAAQRMGRGKGPAALRKPSAGTRLVKAAKQAREMATEGIDIMAIREGQCRFPLTKALPHAFCGAKTAKGSWCAEHLAIIKGKKS